MRLTIEPGPITQLDGVPVRAWHVVDGAPEGTLVYVHRVAIPPDADAEPFERALRGVRPPENDPSPAISRWRPSTTAVPGDARAPGLPSPAAIRAAVACLRDGDCAPTVDMLQAAYAVDDVRAHPTIHPS